MKLFFLAIAFTLFGWLPFAKSITLDQALREALNSHPLLAVYGNRIEAAAGKREQAGLRPNPLFVYQSEDWRAWQSPGHRFWQDADHFFYLQQTFETAAKRSRRVSVAEATRRRTEIELTLQKQIISTRVRAAYWDAVGAQQKELLQRRALERFKEITQYHRDQVREGAMAEADLLRVELEEQRILLSANAAAVDLQMQMIRLQREMGRAEMEPVTLETPFEATAPEVSASFTDAFQLRAEAQLARQVIVLSEAQLDLEKAISTPNFDGVAGYKRSGPFDTLMWGVQVPLPVFNRNQGNISAASAEEHLARNALTSTEALIRAEFEGAVRELNLRRQQLSTSVVPLRERALQTASIAQAAYRLGGADLLRLLDAQRQLLDTEQLYVDAMLALRQAEASVQSAAGVTQ